MYLSMARISTTTNAVPAQDLVGPCHIASDEDINNMLIASGALLPALTGGIGLAMAGTAVAVSPVLIAGLGVAGMYKIVKAIAR